MSKKSRKSNKSVLRHTKNKYAIAGVVIVCVVIIIAAFTVGVTNKQQPHAASSQPSTKGSEKPKPASVSVQPAPTAQSQPKKAMSPPALVPIKIVELIGFQYGQSYSIKEGAGSSVSVVDNYVTMGRVKFSGNAGGKVEWQVEERYGGSLGTDEPKVVKSGSFILPKGQSEYDMSSLGSIYGTSSGTYHQKVRIHFTSPNEFTSTW